MNICINLYGKQKFLSNIVEMINTHLCDDKNNYYILFTGYSSEEEEIEKLIKNIYVKRYEIDQDVLDLYVKKHEDINICKTNHDRVINTIVDDLFIKCKSAETLDAFMLETGINFDLIITTKTDILLDVPIFSKSNNELIKLYGLDTVFIANGPDHDIYKVGAFSDIIFIANVENTKKILEAVNYIDECSILVEDEKIFHPETAFHKLLIKVYELNVQRLIYTATTFTLPVNKKVTNVVSYVGSTTNENIVLSSVIDKNDIIPVSEVTEENITSELDDVADVTVDETVDETVDVTTDATETLTQENVSVEIEEVI
jgi:hypothetical protein